MIIETWLIYTLIVLILAWLLAFFNKVIVEEKYDRNLSIFIFFVTVFFISLFWLLLSWGWEISWWIIWYWVVWAIIDYFFLKARFMALDWVSSSVFFINYRLFSSSALLLIGVFIFGDAITLNELIWFLTGFIIFGLLFEKQKTKNLNYRKWLLGLAICIVTITLLHVWLKFIGSIVVASNDILFYLSMLYVSYSAMWIPITYFAHRESINLKQNNIKSIVWINVLQWFIWIFYTGFLLQTYWLANIGIIYKILSYSIFIPIIWSIIFYHEKLNTKKIIAFILTMISLWFFI